MKVSANMCLIVNNPNQLMSFALCLGINYSDKHTPEDQYDKVNKWVG